MGIFLMILAIVIGAVISLLISKLIFLVYFWLKGGGSRV